MQFLEILVCYPVDKSKIYTLMNQYHQEYKTIWQWSSELGCQQLLETKINHINGIDWTSLLTSLFDGIAGDASTESTDPVETEIDGGRGILSWLVWRDVFHFFFE